MNPVLSKVIRNEHQRLKYQQLEDLASEVNEGVIVELGTYLGYGAIALCTGASVLVYTVDDYQNRRGWAGEVYYRNDANIAMKNWHEAFDSVIKHPYPVYNDVRDTADRWDARRISLLVWDLGMPARLCEDFEVWQSHITGKFVVHDTDDNRLGSDLLNPDGWNKRKDGVFWILEKEL